MMIFLFLLLADPQASEMRHQLIVNMGLDEPFSGYTSTTTATVTIGDKVLNGPDLVEKVDARSPRWAKGTQGSLKAVGFDGQHGWESKAVAASRPSHIQPPDEETKRDRALHEWHLFLIVLLVDPKLDPITLPEPDGRTGLRFINPQNGLLLADVFADDGLPGEVRYYSWPDLKTGKQKIVVNFHTDYRTVAGRTLPYHIRVEEDLVLHDKPVKLSQEVVSWTFYDTLEDSWFTLED